MRHRVTGRKLDRNTNQRKALFRSLANSLILHEKVVTTEAKAKSVRPLVEKLITRAKEDSIHNRRLLIKELVHENSVKKMLEVIGPKFKERNGGYTKLVKIGSRHGDRARMTALIFSEEVSSFIPKAKEEAKKKAVKEVKKPKAQAKKEKDGKQEK